SGAPSSFGIAPTPRQPHTAPLPERSTQEEAVMQEAENTRLVQEGFAAFGRGDIDALLGYYADDIVFHPAYGTASYVPTSGVRTGKAAVGEFFKTLAEAVR